MTNPLGQRWGMVQSPKSVASYPPIMSPVEQKSFKSFAALSSRRSWFSSDLRTKPKANPGAGHSNIIPKAIEKPLEYLRLRLKQFILEKYETRTPFVTDCAGNGSKLFVLCRISSFRGGNAQKLDTIQCSVINSNSHPWLNLHPHPVHEGKWRT